MRNARDIGKALGVATILEGSVRRSGNRVRVNVQLINADNDEHIWAENYDGDLTDVFAIQTDLAGKIASALQAKLSPNEKARLDRQPTQNPDAYLLFVQAHDYASKREMFHDTSLKAEPLFEQAIKLDPNFALAFAGLSMVESWLYHTSDPVPARREKARLNADEALRLQPDFPKVISHSVSLIIMAIAITSALWPSSKSPDAAYLTSLRRILLSALFSGVRVSGRNQTPIWKKQPRSIRKTQTS
jgi:tetratricopeptide (TPR) repeat protein